MNSMDRRSGGVVLTLWVLSVEADGIGDDDDDEFGGDDDDGIDGPVRFLKRANALLRLSVVLLSDSRLLYERHTHC